MILNHSKTIRSAISVQVYMLAAAMQFAGLSKFAASSKTPVYRSLSRIKILHTSIYIL